MASVATTDKNTASSGKSKRTDGGTSNNSGYKGSHPLCDSCGRHHPGKCQRSKSVEKSEINQLKYEINKLKKKTRRANKATRAKDFSSSDSDSSTEDDKRASKASKIRFAKAASQTSSTTSGVVFNADSGCTDTMVNSSTLLQNSHSLKHCPIQLANDSVIQATREGDTVLPFGRSTIPGLLVPNLSENLLSIGQLADHDIQSVFTKDGVCFYKGDVNIDGELVGRGTRSGGKYLVRAPATCLSTSSGQNLLTWHQRLSHLGEAAIRRLERQGLIKVTSWY